MTSHRILIRVEYLNVRFFSIFLFVYALQVLKVLFDANFRKTLLKGLIVRFILHHPVVLLSQKLTLIFTIP